MKRDSQLNKQVLTESAKFLTFDNFMVSVFDLNLIKLQMHGFPNYIDLLKILIPNENAFGVEIDITGRELIQRQGNLKFLI